MRVIKKLIILLISIFYVMSVLANDCLLFDEGQQYWEPDQARYVKMASIGYDVLEKKGYKIFSQSPELEYKDGFLETIRPKRAMVDSFKKIGQLYLIFGIIHNYGVVELRKGKKYFLREIKILKRIGVRPLIEDEIYVTWPKPSEEKEILKRLGLPNTLVTIYKSPNYVDLGDADMTKDELIKAVSEVPECKTLLNQK